MSIRHQALAAHSGVIEYLVESPGWMVLASFKGSPHYNCTEGVVAFSSDDFASNV